MLCVVYAGVKPEHGGQVSSNRIMVPLEKTLKMKSSSGENQLNGLVCNKGKTVLSGHQYAEMVGAK